MTQVCPNCQHPNRAEAKFCAHCRAPLPSAAPAVPAPVIAAPPPPLSASMPSADAMLCPHCGKPLNVRAKFCNYCGQPLTSTPAPQVVAQLGSQPVPPAAPMIVPQMTSNASAPQSPPPYTPPAFTPRKRQGLSRRQKIMAATVSAVMLIIVVFAITQIAPLVSTPAITATPTETLPALLVPTLTPTAQATIRIRPTSTQESTPGAGENSDTYLVRDGQTLIEVAYEYCAGIQDEQKMGYAQQIADKNKIPWNSGNPIIRAGDKLKMPPCP